MNFSRRQRRIFLACFICYMTAYVGRLNLSAALNGLCSEMALTDAQGGLIQTAFALVYAAGQLINGSVVDRLSARRHMTLGMILSCVFNILFGLVGDYRLLVILWALNGAAQSMLWTPIVKLLATWFRGKRRGNASLGLAMTLIAGNLSAWALSGWLASEVNWRYSFIIPGIIVGLSSIAVSLMVMDRPEPGEDLGEDLGEENAPRAQREVSNTSMPVGELMGTTGLIFVLGCCVCNGFIRDGIITWAPTIIAQLNSGTAIPSTAVSLLIPMLNLIGVLMTTRCFHLLHDNARLCVASLMGLTAVLTVFLRPASSGIILFALMLGLTCATTYGLNPALTTLIPLEYEKVGRVSFVAGIVDCFIYIGSSLAGVVTGIVSDTRGWNVVFVLWCVVAVTGTTLAVCSMRGLRKLK